MYRQSVLYPFDGELLYERTHVWSNLTTRRDSEREERVGSGERAPILVFLSLGCVGEMFSCMACCLLRFGAGARVNDGNVE